MSSDQNLKLIIVGAGPTGLTLANMLERFGIDYVLLGAYDDLAPSIGDDIDLWPQVLRILDQLNCYDQLLRGGAPHEHGADVGQTTLLQPEDVSKMLRKHYFDVHLNIR